MSVNNVLQVRPSSSPGKKKKRSLAGWGHKKNISAEEMETVGALTAKS